MTSTLSAAATTRPMLLPRSLAHCTQKPYVLMCCGSAVSSAGQEKEGQSVATGTARMAAGEPA